MRLRPATPLAIAFFLAFILLLISTISTPIVKAIPLAVYGDFHFGVFGYCGPNNFCSSPTVRYNIDINGIGDDGNFTLAEPTRHSLSSILIVHPIAAFLTLICTIMATAAHFHSPSHSAPFLLWLLILSFPTLLITLLAFLVDILLFVPHLAWGGWIVLGSTVLISCCSVLTCAMRRTLVSRKARKKRIAEDDDMNGNNAEGVYQPTTQPQLAKETGLANDSQYIRAESPPPLDGAAASRGYVGDKGPSFAAYNVDRSRRPSTDDRVPLNPNRDPSIRTTSSHGRSHRGRDGLNVTVPDRNGYGGSGRVSPVSPTEYDNAAGGQYGRHPDHRYYDGHQRGGRGGGAPPYYSRGRSGYPPARGGYPPRGYPSRGGPGSRGGYPARGGMHPQRGGPGSSGIRGPPPPGQWRDDMPLGPMAAGAGAGAAAGGAMMGCGQRGPPSYENQQYPPYAQHQQQSQPQQPGAYHDWPAGRPYDEQEQAYRQPTPPSQRSPNTAFPSAAAFYGAPAAGPAHNDSRGASSPHPIVTTNNQTSTPTSVVSPTREPTSFGFSGRQPSPARSRSQSRVREEAAASAGPLPPMPTQHIPQQNEALPIGQAIEMDANSGSPAMSAHAGNEGEVISPIGAAIGDIQRGFSPQQQPTRTPTSHSQHSQHNPVELPGHPITTSSAPPAKPRTRASSDAYYEDVPAQFASSSDPPPTVEQLQQQVHHQNSHPLTHQQQQQQYPPRQQSHPHPQARDNGNGNNMLPASLTPGAYLAPHSTSARPSLPSENSQSSFYNDGPSTAGPTRTNTTSPSAISDSSNFTSVSQRGVNPEWAVQQQYAQPGQYAGGYSQGVDRQRRPPAQERVLDTNPDFGIGTRRHARGASGDGEGRYPAV